MRLENRETTKLPLAARIYQNIRWIRPLLRRVAFAVGVTSSGQRIKSFPYVFVIGFNKTATSSISHFFTSHKIPSVHHDGGLLVAAMLRNLRRGRKIFHGYDREYKVFSDLIFASKENIVEGNRFFETMQRDYPDSLFILNNRVTGNWIRSRSLHANGEFLRWQLGILGSTDPLDAFSLWERQKRVHEEQVKKYFKNFPNQFVEIDIENEDFPAIVSQLLGVEFEKTHWKKINETPKDPLA